MNLQTTVEIFAGGPGSGCNPLAGKCGRTMTLYHGTSVGNADSIKKNGLRTHNPNWKSNQKNSASLTIDEEMAHNYGYWKAHEKGEKQYAVLKFKVPEAFVHRNMRLDPEEESSLLLNRDLNTKYLQDVKVHNVKDLPTEVIYNK